MDRSNQSVSLDSRPPRLTTGASVGLAVVGQGAHVLDDHTVDGLQGGQEVGDEPDGVHAGQPGLGGQALPHPAPLEQGRHRAERGHHRVHEDRLGDPVAEPAPDPPQGLAAFRALAAPVPHQLQPVVLVVADREDERGRPGLGQFDRAVTRAHGHPSAELRDQGPQETLLVVVGNVHRGRAQEGPEVVVDRRVQGGQPQAPGLGAAGRTR